MHDGVVFHAGLGDPEGPVLLPDGSLAVVEMSTETGHVSVVSSNGVSRRVVVKTGRPNGMVMDSDGLLWVAESMNPPSLLRVDLDGSSELVLIEGAGNRFLFPNDLAFGPDGALYMTDSGVLRSEIQKIPAADRPGYPFEGKLFWIDIESKKAKILDDGLRFPNGLAFGRDRALYVTTTADGLIHRYEWLGEGNLGVREHFADLVDDSKSTGSGGFVGGDGLAVGASGNLYCAVFGQGNVTVIDPVGNLLHRITVGGEEPTNVAFGPFGSGCIYVTVKDTGKIERHQVGENGLAMLPSKNRND